MKGLWVLYALLFIYLTGCSVKGSVKEKHADPELPVLSLEYVDTVLHKSYVATINACQNVELRAKVSGFLEQLFVDEGQAVKKGQLLFRLNDAEFRVQQSEAAAALASARAELKATQVEMDRVKTLVEKKVLSPSELVLAETRLSASEAKLEEAKAGEEKARIRLELTAVRAPFDGVIDRIPHKIGSLIAEGTLLTTLSDIHAMHAYFNLSESEYLGLMQNAQHARRLKQPVDLILADGSRYPYRGYIETMGGEFQQGTGSIAFRAKFPNPSSLLKHGASGKVRLATPARNALIIPQRAVFEIQNRNYVFVVQKDSTVKMKSFEAGGHIEDFILVRSGLTDSDRIVYEGVQNIKDGSRISPRPVSMDSVLALQQAQIKI